MAQVDEIVELQRAHDEQAELTGLPLKPLLIPTEWDVGPVAAFLFTNPPVTLIDAAVDGEDARSAFSEGFAGAGVEIVDLERIIVTHGHSDHIGSAKWLQDESGCEVLMHEDDVSRTPSGWGSMIPLFEVLGLPAATIEEMMAGRRSARKHWELPMPELTELFGGEVFESGSARLRVEHHSGHSPGHIWVIEEGTGVVFGGDFVLETSATTAGAVADSSHPAGIRPMLAEYEKSLRELLSREVRVIFPSHGPPVTDHRSLIERRLWRSAQRSEAVLKGLRELGEATPYDVTVRVHGERIWNGLFQFLTEVFGRLEMLMAQGQAESRMDGGVVKFKPL